MTPLERVLARFTEARRNSTGWMVHCPAHEDHTASLSVTEGRDGAVLLHCHAGCSADAVVAAVGLTLADLFAAKDAARTVVAEYDYHDAHGQLLIRSCASRRRAFDSAGPMGGAAGRGA